jgi:outer membrane protein, multidrug efflux system
MPLAKRLITLLLALAGTGCMFHDNTPIAKAPETFTVDNGMNPVKNLPEYPWWKDIGSVELNELVTESLEKNKNVSIAIKNIELAQSSLDTIRLSWLPSFYFMAGRVQGNATTLLPNLPVPLSATGNFSAFLPTWIVNIIALPNKTKEAEKNVEATASEYLALKTSIAAQVVSSYAVLLASSQETIILNSLKDNLNTRLKTVRSMVNRGLNTEVALNNIDSEMQKLEAQITTNQSNIVAAKNALLTLVGRQISSFTPREQFSSLKLHHVAPGNTPTSVLETRPDVVAARAKIQGSDYGISSAVSLFAPIPTFLSANLRSTADNNNVNSSTTASVQAGVALWALDPKYIGRINTSNKQYDSAIINYLSVVDQALKEVDDALANFQANQSKLNNEEKSLTNSRKNLDTTKAMFKNGLVSDTQYLEGLTRLDLAKMSILQTKVQLIIAFSKLYQSMGGGATYGDKQYQLQDQTITTKNAVTSTN